MTEVTRIAVLGAGDMGHGVAELAALKGFEVRLRDIDQAVLDKAVEKVSWSLDKLAEHGTITKELAAQALARLSTHTDLAEAVGDADLVIEAVPEKLALKQQVFAEVEAAAPAHAVLASNTSTMRITEIGAKLEDPSRLVGMHFFNPVLLMDLVEIIPGEASSDEALATAEAVSERLGKTFVTLAKDTPGFVTSRLISVWVGAGVMAHDAGIAEPRVIDAAMKFKAGFPMGPFELADYTGLDIGAHASGYMAERLGEHYRASPTLQALVDAGDLGKKTGKGFYTWKENRLAEPPTPEDGQDFETTFILAIVANEAARLLAEGVASAAEIDLAMRNGCAFPKGPLAWADEHGLDGVVEALEMLHKSTGSPLTEPQQPLVERVEAGKLGRKTGEGFHAYAKGQSEETVLETVKLEVDEEHRLGYLVLDRPHRLNALNDQLIADLSAGLGRLSGDDRVRVIVLTGTGEKAFCVGADLQDAGEATPVTMAEVARQGHLLCIAIEKSRKPVVAAINGYAFGGGLELALPCDFRLMARRAKLGLPEVTLGLLPAMGGTQRLPKLVGLAAAKEVAMLGDRIGPDEALRLGLVHRVFENDTFGQDVRVFAAELAKRAPVALAFTKQLLNAAPTTDLLAGMEAEATAFGLVSTTDDVVEGVTAMFAKKEPAFKGR